MTCPIRSTSHCDAVEWHEWKPAKQPSTHASLIDAVEQSRLLDKLVEQTFLAHKSCRRVKFGNVAMIENNDAVGVHDRIDSMGDGDDRSILEDIAAQCTLEHLVGLNVNGRSGFVKDCIPYSKSAIMWQSNHSVTVMQHLPRMFVGVSSALAKEIN